MKLSIVSTMFKSQDYIDEFYKRISDVAKQLAHNSYEIILVNDGSPDNSLEIAKEISAKDTHVKTVDLSRNFGHHKAMMTGLSTSIGEQVFLIDIDLEEEPELLRQFSEQFNSEEVDVVYGKQDVRKGGYFERISGEWFYKIINFLTNLELPANMVTARLMSRRYVDALLMHKEREIFLAGLWHITGFVQKPLIINKKSHSETTYTLSRKLSLLINSVTSFSNAPLKGIFYIGLFISFFSGIYVVYLIANTLFFSTPVSGWTSLMASIWLLGGMIISFIGVIGIYLSKIFSETKQRPYTIIRETYGKQPD